MTPHQTGFKQSRWPGQAITTWTLTLTDQQIESMHAGRVAQLMQGLATVQDALEHGPLDEPIDRDAPNTTHTS